MSGLRFFPEAASTLAPGVDDLFLFLVVLSLFFGLLVAGLIVRFMVKYRRRSEDERAPEIHGSLVLEALWMGIPLAIALGIFAWGASLYAAIRRPPNDALRVNVVGKQWMWKVQHLEGKREINELHVPVGRAVELVMTSEDVIHSFFVPAFRVKMDVVPGRYQTMWFEATKAGTYHLFCAEYCGTLHSGMIGSIVAMDPADFQAWLAGATPGAPASSMADAGRAIFEAQGCASCHTGDTPRGPSLVGIVGKEQKLADGQTVVVDDTYLRQSILDPGAHVVQGYQPLMPTFQGLIGEEDLMRLIAYIRSLESGGST
jgi:cytochrome c oxidase subunit 2